MKFAKAPAQIIDDWIAALRSGKYRQGRLRLARAVKSESKEKVITHCCLGVLCDVAGYPLGVDLSYNGEIGAPPLELCRYVGAIDTAFSFPKELCPVTDWPINPTSLISLNDDVQLSFEDIADFIEKNRDAFLMKA